MSRSTKDGHAPPGPVADLHAGRELIVAVSRRAVVEHLGAREELALGPLADQCRAVPPGAGPVLLRALARALGVEPGLLRANDLLEALFDIALEARTLVPREEWSALDPPDGIEPLPAALLDELHRVTDPSRWEELAATITPPPRNDSQWLNVMLGLRVDEWVRTYAPAVKPDAIRDTPG